MMGALPRIQSSDSINLSSSGPQLTGERKLTELRERSVVEWKFDRI